MKPCIIGPSFEALVERSFEQHSALGRNETRFVPCARAVARQLHVNVVAEFWVYAKSLSVTTCLAPARSFQALQVVHCSETAHHWCGGRRPDLKCGGEEFGSKKVPT